MNKIYIEISKLGDKFRDMCYSITKDKEKIDDAVQELMLYLLQINPEIIKKIYDADGIDGITRYGAVVLRRALTSTRSPFYYKYRKYYKNLVGINYQTTSTQFHKWVYNMPNEVDHIQKEKQDKLEKIDVVLDNLDSWYDRELFKLYYYEGNTLDSLAAKTKISRNSLFTTIDKVRTIIKEELSE
tara:strand:+ start:5257 stop:5811 length:555 start_codon:yes stop_codon:yes gene_type:complete